MWKRCPTLLAPWQKLTAIRAHVLARAGFLCRNSRIQKRDVADLDKTLVRGGATLPKFRSLLDIHAFPLLASNDPTISGVAAASLRSVVRKILRDPTPDLRTQSACPRPAQAWLSGSSATKWRATSSLSWRVLWIRGKQLRPSPPTPPLTTSFRRASICDWNFIHRARLGCLQLNATRRFGNRDPRCRKCGYSRETIPYVLNHCKPHSVAWRKRHSAIQNRVVRAIPLQLARSLLTKPLLTKSLIPDLVLRKKSGEVYIIDFTEPFEDQPESLSAARQHKIEKYLPIVEHLRREGETAFVDAIVVGSLGSWDPSNDAVLARMGISRRYANLMRKLIVPPPLNGVGTSTSNISLGYCRFNLKAIETLYNTFVVLVIPCEDGHQTERQDLPSAPELPVVSEEQGVMKLSIKVN
ncbi:reverse transcriptase domain-containing protein [Nephila pilipes]|uniref:Reverse transcriptase domain-containing protein n=1 Tax=Nephila pilipes TaxID=299642 RepID=A0A8X6TE60_NEPPI|nr:reverse transcriptase domain-containing protein [Nephila pilipes]